MEAGVGVQEAAILELVGAGWVGPEKAKVGVEVREVGSKEVGVTEQEVVREEAGMEGLVTVAKLQEHLEEMKAGLR